MSANFDAIRDLTPLKVKSSWRIHVRVLLVWKIAYDQSKEPSSVQILVIDSQGDKIQVNIKKQLIRQFQDKLVEGNSYIFKNFDLTLVPKYTCYRTNNHPYAISFWSNTSIEPKPSNDIPMESWNFENFTHLLTHPPQNKYLIDIIGEVLSVEALNAGDGRNILNVELQDIDKTTLSVTLWNNHASEVSEFMASDQASKCRPILALKNGVTKQFQDKLYVENSKFNSRVYIDSNISAINEFKERLVETNGLESDYKGVSQFLSRGGNSFHDEFLNHVERKTLEELTNSDVQQKVNYVVYATIACIIEDGDWFYIGCNKCNRKVFRSSHEYHNESAQSSNNTYSGFNCERCKLYPAAVSPRFRIQVRVIDSTSCAKFLLWDKDVFKLINRKAIQLCDQQSKNSIIDPRSYPSELRNMLDKKCLFKIQLPQDSGNSNSTPVFKVAKLTEEVDIVQNFLEVYPLDEVVCSSPFGKSIDSHGLNQNISKVVKSETDDNSLGLDDLSPFPSIPTSKNSEGHNPPSVQSSNNRKRKLIVDVEEDY